MIQKFIGPVQHVAGRDVVVVQQVVPSCLSPEEFELVLAYRAERARQQSESDEEGSK